MECTFPQLTVLEEELIMDSPNLSLALGEQSEGKGQSVKGEAKGQKSPKKKVKPTG